MTIPSTQQVSIQINKMHLHNLVSSVFSAAYQKLYAISSPQPGSRNGEQLLWRATGSFKIEDSDFRQSFRMAISGELTVQKTSENKSIECKLFVIFRVNQTIEQTEQYISLSIIQMMFEQLNDPNITEAMTHLQVSQESYNYLEKIGLYIQNAIPKCGNWDILNRFHFDYNNDIITFNFHREETQLNNFTSNEKFGITIFIENSVIEEIINSIWWDKIPKTFHVNDDVTIKLIGYQLTLVGRTIVLQLALAGELILDYGVLGNATWNINFSNAVKIVIEIENKNNQLEFVLLGIKSPIPTITIVPSNPLAEITKIATATIIDKIITRIIRGKIRDFTKKLINVQVPLFTIPNFETDIDGVKISASLINISFNESNAGGYDEQAISISGNYSITTTNSSST